MTPESRDRTTILVHYYRAMVGRADIWRLRMDTTINWAIGATAITLSFLLLEARRLTFYHLWQGRVLLLEKELVRPALSSAEEGRSDLEAQLGPQLGRTIPTMPLGKAAARRLRRIYLYLFAAQLLAWVVKLSSHPEPASSMEVLVDRAGTGPVPGWAVVGLVATSFCGTLLIALWKGGLGAREDAATSVA